MGEGCQCNNQGPLKDQTTFWSVLAIGLTLCTLYVLVWKTNCTRNELLWEVLAYNQQHFEKLHLDDQDVQQLCISDSVCSLLMYCSILALAAHRA